jgi:site-specific recombinase XerD
MDSKLEEGSDEYLDFFAKALRSKKLTPKISTDFCEEVRRYFYWRGECGHQPAGSRWITSLDIESYLNDYKRSNPSAACNRVQASLRSFQVIWTNYAGLDNNPTLTITNIRDSQNCNSWLDAEQQRQLEAVIDQQLQTPQTMVAWRASRVRSAVLVRFLLHTGMHTVEVRSLRLGDIHLGESRGWVQVSGRRERRLPLDGPTCTALRVWQIIRPEGEDDWLWLEGDMGRARQISVRTIWRACRRMVLIAGLDPEFVSPRILRNTCAHNLLVAGESPLVVRRLLKLSTTKTYLRYL